MTTPVDDMPIEVRRLNWGWFGDPWSSGICYDDNGRLLEEMRKPFPAGENCLHCTEPIVVGDSGQAMPYVGTHSRVVRHVHKECLLRAVTGSVTCMTGEHQHDTGQTYRQEALAVWAHLQRAGA
jgi:hypothetical protein